MSETTRVTDKGQTTIPHKLRRKYGIEPGDQVVWEETEVGIVLRKRRRNGARGVLFAEDVDEDTKEKAVSALERELLEKRHTEWTIE